MTTGVSILGIGPVRCVDGGKMSLNFGFSARSREAAMAVGHLQQPRGRFAKLSILIALGMSSCSTVALAQTAAEPAAQLPEIEVTAKAKKQGAKQATKKSSAPKAAPKQAAPAAAAPAPEGAGNGTSMSTANGPVDGYVAGNTSFGSKTNTPISQVPQSVSVVGRNEIDDQGAQKTDEALRYTSGVFAQPFGADSDTNWLFIRGFQATQSGIYQDGLPLYATAFGSFFVDSFGLERIEVLKGASSVLYGGANPGGIVNYVSKKPDGERIRRLEAGVDEFGTGYLGMDIGGAATSNFDYRVSGRILGGDGYTDFADGFRGFIDPKLSWHNDETRLTLLGTYGAIDETHGGGSFLPYVGTVVSGPFGRISREFNYTDPSIDSYKREQGSIGYELEHELNDQLIFRQNARYGAASVEESLLYPFGWRNGDPNTGLLERINFGHDTMINTFLIDNQLEAKVRTGALAHTFLFGADYKFFKIDQTQASTSSFPGGTAQPINPFDPVYGLPQGTRGTYIDQDLTQEQYGVYLQDQIRFGGGWIVTLNGRYDWVDTELDNHISGVGTTGDDGEASGRAGIGYTFANGLTPYVSASTFFNPTIGTDATGALFKPQTGQQYEAGFKYAPTFLDAIFTAAIFDLTQQNTLSPLDPFTQVQTAEVNSRGFEFEGKANITESLRATASFTAYDLEVTKDDDHPQFVGKRPFLIPEVMASASLDYKFREGFMRGLILGGGVRYLGYSFADELNTLKVPDVTLFDAKIGYDFGSWGIDLNATNLFDEAYVSGCQGVNVCSYGESRVVKLKTHVTW